MYITHTSYIRTLSYTMYIIFIAVSCSYYLLSNYWRETFDTLVKQKLCSNRLKLKSQLPLD